MRIMAMTALVAAKTSRETAFAQLADLLVAVGEGRLIDLATAFKPDEWAESIAQIGTNNDVKAFERLYRHFAPRIKTYLVKSGGLPGQAEEATQEAMANVWLKAAQFDRNRASAATWIFTIARNKQVDAIRKHRFPEPEALDKITGSEPDPASAYEIADEKVALLKALEQVPETQRLAIQKAYFSDLSQNEIAALTGLPIGTIKSRIRLGLDRLRHEMMKKR